MSNGLVRSTPMPCGCSARGRHTAVERSAHGLSYGRAPADANRAAPAKSLTRPPAACLACGLDLFTSARRMGLGAPLQEMAPFGWFGIPALRENRGAIPPTSNATTALARDA